MSNPLLMALIELRTIRQTLEELRGEWGCRFVDLDLDGYQDLFVANGHVNDYADENSSGPGYAQPCLVLHN
jgi:hypothetical protein